MHFFYYPKWKHAGTEATISWDVSGYYMYLPAAFIYHDLREVKFLDEVLTKYRPTPYPYQTFTHPSGRQVMKYSVGQAVLYSPFFFLAHAWASASGAYPADGFSFPYQFMISLGSLVVSFLGLFWLLTLLRHYFPERVVALTLLLLVFGTNYLNYAAIDGAMTHNHVFSLYALLLLTTHRFYAKPALGRALLIGACLGLMALTRPTEIVAAILPLLWGLNVLRRSAWRERFAFFATHARLLVAAVGVTLAIGSVQLIYWKYVSGDWLVYSYQDQGFDWLRTHFHAGMFSYKAGWLVYTPLMAFGLLGFIPLFRRRPDLFPALFLHAALFIYVAFSWSVWWYGGSLGQRTMVQTYVVFAFPLAAFVQWAFFARSQVLGEEHPPAPRGGEQGKSTTLTALRVLLTGVILLFIYHNLWFTHQAHRGGLFLTEQMTKAYFWRTLYTYGIDHDDRLALDTPEFFPGTPQDSLLLFAEDFENRPVSCGIAPVSGQGALCLKESDQNSPDFIIPIQLPPGTWLRASFDARIDATRYNIDNSAQFLLIFRRNGEEVKRRLIRIHRVLNHNWHRAVHLDATLPAEGADELVVAIWNGGAAQPALLLDNLRIHHLKK
ncbi:hypothetical protein QWY85_04105 [Neolewinella lacunae]|uniref:Glycosyltransferase RgtA/B/C/D-like domain-containing protein n=1 Tax=Neolewinella lacunae TaxID=1517758 RepID=A0A923T9L5_9BACT|nr:hypothetical protein [Neolewinella lacunae]MBC6996850.1 hypothetical protein [Neolewinella lacunae]MDN3633828.1 hypothetical protein [Neolewinella lacunae]